MVIGAIFTAVSIYYYLGVVRAMYMRPAPRGRRPAARRLATSRSRWRSSSRSSSRVGSFFAVSPLIDVIETRSSFLPYPF